MKVQGAQPTSTWNQGFVAAPALNLVRNGAQILKPGHQGPSVLQIKRLFNQIGANNSKYVPLVENENFDKELLAKVSRFQSNHPEIFSRQNHGNVTRATLLALEAASRGRQADIETDPVTPDEPFSNEGFWYEVRSGDSLDKIARRFKLESHLDLIADDQNEGLRSNPHAIRPGQKVWIPVDAPAETADTTAEVSDSLAQVPRDTTGNVIRPGESNPLVETVRATLRKLGYRGPLGATGNEFDHKTEVGVRWYQANFDSYRGRVDGVIGEQTWSGFRRDLGVTSDRTPSELLNARPATTPMPAPPIESGVRTAVHTTVTRQDTVRLPANDVFPAEVAIPVTRPGESYATIVELPALRRQITRGKRGLDVEMAQRVLNMAGANPPLAVDASAGSALQTAVIAFQRSHNLESTNGVIGPETWAAFSAELEGEPAARNDITFGVDSNSLTTTKQRNALRTLQVLGQEDPTRARQLARYAGVTPGSPLVVDRALVDRVVALTEQAGMPLDFDREAGDVSYESSRVLMTFLEQVVKRNGVSTRAFDVTRYDAMLTAAAERHSVDPALVKAIMKSESNFNQTRGGRTLTSPAGALGLMQLMPGTARQMGVDPNDAAGNIEGGVKYIARQLRRYNGDIQRVAAAYNAGPGAVDKYNGVPPYRETMGYVRKVQAAYEHYRATGQP